MTQKIAWDETGKRTFETGVDHGVLYVLDTNLNTYPEGIPWNGLTTVTDKPSGAGATPLYADNMKYLNLIALEEFGATIEAYTYPDEFAECDGSVEPTPGVFLGQQSRKVFGFAYRTRFGNDSVGDSYGYKLHLVYGAQAAPSQKAYASVNDSPSAISFSWEVTTTALPVTGYKSLATIVIDSTKVDSAKLAALEVILYGTEGGADGRLPLPAEVVSLMTVAAPSAVSVTASPLDEASGVAVDANIVLTFNNKILSEAITVASAAGVLKAVGRGWDTAGKVLTLDPTTNFAGSTTYIVTIAGVVDIYGQVLATSVINFGTAS